VKPKHLIAAMLLFIGVFVGLFWLLDFGVFAESDQSKAEHHLGSGAVCGDSRSSTLRCTKDGVVLTCVVHGDRVGCGQGDHPMAEGTKP
jgi:hypothetical protein